MHFIQVGAGIIGNILMWSKFMSCTGNQSIGGHQCYTRLAVLTKSIQDEMPMLAEAIQ